MKIKNFYSFPGISDETNEKIDFNQYGSKFNELLFENNFLEFFNEIRGLRELRLFFQKDFDFEGVKEEYLRDGYFLSPPFLENPFLKPHSILPFFINCDRIKWSSLTDQEKKEFMVSKWILFFKNLPKHYLKVTENEIVEATKKLVHLDWGIQ